MKLSEFDFDLPKELIAQLPTKKRDHSNLLVCHNNAKYSICKFFQILDILEPGDLLVFNDSKVINAKLLLDKDNKAININLNKPENDNTWLAFAKPAKKLSIGDEFTFASHKLVITDKLENGEIKIKFELKDKTIFEFLAEYGHVPLPQYIKREKQNLADQERYQNIYSKKQGSVAAPTAGLHFSKRLLDKIKAKNIETAFVTLHVGAGTFLPVKSEHITKHKMHSEICEIDKITAAKINRAKKQGRRIIAVGTTTVRTLESCAEDSVITPQIINTDIFITPGYNFQITDCLITNFHLPKSTLFMLVCAFAGINRMHSAYKYAIDKKMRFFSYGDAMFIERHN